MKFYHGSKNGISGPIAPISRDACDFGRGFYMGTEPTQPLTLICRVSGPRMYTCEADFDGLSLYRFSPDIDWALFIAYCRKRMPPKYRRIFAPRYREILKHDVIFGKIANDKIFYVLDFFFDNLATDAAVIKSLSALNLGDQYCLKTRKACAKVSIAEERILGSGECRKLQIRSENQRRRAAAIVDRIMDENHHTGLMFSEILIKKVEELGI